MVIVDPFLNGGCLHLLCTISALPWIIFTTNLEQQLSQSQKSFVLNSPLCTATVLLNWAVGSGSGSASRRKSLPFPKWRNGVEQSGLAHFETTCSSLRISPCPEESQNHPLKHNHSRLAFFVLARMTQNRHQLLTNQLLA